MGLEGCYELLQMCREEKGYSWQKVVVERWGVKSKWMFRYSDIWGWCVRCHITSSLFGVFISGQNWLVETVPAPSTETSWWFLLPWFLVGLYNRKIFMYLYFKKFTFQSFQIRQSFLDFSELRYSSGMRLYLYVQFRMTKVMGLVFVISFLLVFISPELIWAENLISPLALGLQWLLGTIAEQRVIPLGSNSWPRK